MPAATATKPSLPLDKLVEQRRFKSILVKARGIVRETMGEVRRLKLKMAYDLGHCIFQAMEMCQAKDHLPLLSAFASNIGEGMDAQRCGYCLRFYALTADHRPVLKGLLDRQLGLSVLYPALEWDVPDEIGTEVLRQVADREIGPRDLTQVLADHAASARRRRRSVIVQTSVPRARHRRLQQLTELTKQNQEKTLEMLLDGVLRQTPESLMKLIRQKP